MTESKLGLRDHLTNETEEFLDDVLAGLTGTPKRIPSKYLYDTRGSQLFDQICELPEYYPTRTELQIMRDNSEAIARAVGKDCAIVELGSGSGTKTELLLESSHVHHYIPVDVSRSHLMDSAERLQAQFTDLKVTPVCADFTQPGFLPDEILNLAERRVVYFPGSTIGNFTVEAAESLLSAIANCCHPHGGLLIGIDLQKPIPVLQAAYDDAQGVTSDFNLNLLKRMQRELNAELEPDAFQHLALYNASKSRMELYLQSRAEQEIVIDDQVIHIEENERILTEYSHKYDADVFAATAAEHGFQLKEKWLDADQQFAILFFEYDEALSNER